MKKEREVSLIYKPKNKQPLSVAFIKKAKSEILGKNYSLSLVFASNSLSKKLNTVYRGKKSPADILSFPLAKDEGEVFINPTVARKNAGKFGRKFENFLKFLLIHALCHLKGMKHSSKMENEEKKFRKKFRV